MTQGLQKRISDAGQTGVRGSGPAFAGVFLCTLGGLFLAQAGDSETFLTIGFLLGGLGLLGIVIGGVAIGIQMARD